MPTADQKDFIVDNGLDANESIKIGAQTVTSLVDSAQVSTIAREPANASAIALAGGASSKAYDSAELLPTSGNDSGDFGYVASTNRLYLWNGSGWYNIALINTSPTVSTSPDSNYELDGTAGTAVTVTMVATDPEGVAITYTQTSDSASNFVNITQDSGVFTLTPLTKAQADSNGVGSGGTFSITFKATDGVNIVPRVSSFTISWIIYYNWLTAAQEAQLTASSAQNNAYFGSDVSLNEDASTAAIGSYGHDLAKGVGYIFDRNNTTWSQTAKLQISLSNRNSYQQAQFGYSAAISGNGNYAVFGAPFAYYSSQSYGKAFVFKKSSGTWAELSGGQLEASTSANRANDDWMGSDVDIDKTGTRIIVGASRANHPSRSDAGGAYIFTNNGSDSYSYETFLQDANAASKGIAQAGDSVAISSNGGTYAIVGADNYNGNGGTRSGAAFIYVRSGTSWSQQTTLQASDAASDDRFGKSVDIDKDGETAVVGAWYDDHSSLTNPGSAYVFTRGTVQLLNSIANTTLDHTSEALSGSGLNSGASDPRGLTFNADGTKVYVTDNNHNDLSTYSLSTAFDVSSSSLTYDGDSYSFDLTATAGSTPYSPRFNNDGTRMYILEGANDTIYQYNLTSGYDVSTMSYSNVSFSTTSQDSSARGIEFSPDGTKLYMVGAGTDTIYQYTLSTAWDLSTASYANKSFSVTSQDTTPYHMVLHSSGTKMIVLGTVNDSLYQYSLSTAYDISTASYDNLSKSITNEQSTPAGLALNNDGSKLYLTGNTGDNIDRYSLDTSLWNQAQKLTAPTPTGSVAFGESVSIDDRGTKIIVGERYYSSQTGRAYVYRKVGSTWYYTKTIYASNQGTDDAFGKKVSLSGDGGYAAIGAVNEDTASGENSGMVYIQKAPVIASGTTVTQYLDTETRIQHSDVGTTSDYFGRAIALDTDGNTAIVSAPFEDTDTTNAGRCYIFVKSAAGAWSEQYDFGSGLTQANSYFGMSGVSISGDGNVALAGKPSQDSGRVAIHTRSGTSWSSYGALTGEYNDSQFGKSCAISGDGSTIAVGASRMSGSSSSSLGNGAAYIYVKNSSNVWTLQQKINPNSTGSQGSGDQYFGESITLSNDGNTVAIGAPGLATSGSVTGRIEVWTRSGTTWTHQQTVVPSSRGSRDTFGWRCALSGTDGNTLVVGQLYESSSYAGYAWIFTRSGTTWTQEAALRGSDTANADHFGSAVAISNDGTTVLVGAEKDTISSGQDSGSAYLFVKSSGTWSQQIKYEPNSPSNADQYGYAVGLSKDASTIMVGAIGEDTGATDAGSVYIYGTVTESY